MCRSPFTPATMANRLSRTHTRRTWPRSEKARRATSSLDGRSLLAARGSRQSARMSRKGGRRQSLTRSRPSAGALLGGVVARCSHAKKPAAPVPAPAHLAATLRVVASHLHTRRTTIAVAREAVLELDERIRSGVAGPESETLRARLEKVTGVDLAELVKHAEAWPGPDGGSEGGKDASPSRKPAPAPSMADCRVRRGPSPPPEKVSPRAKAQRSISGSVVSTARTPRPRPRQRPRPPQRGLPLSVGTASSPSAMSMRLPAPCR